jgi:deoxyuridine 5'-triphosphate nucleotidohydrolase
MEGNNVTFEFRKILENAKLPSRKRSTDIGYDVFAVEFTVIPSHGSRVVRTGIQISAPPGWYFTLDGRSGLGKNGIHPFRGIIDSGFTGEMSLVLFNTSNADYFVNAGDRVAQLVAHRQTHVEFKEVEEFSPEYNARGEKGWGSSGR